MRMLMFLSVILFSVPAFAQVTGNTINGVSEIGASVQPPRVFEPKKQQISVSGWTADGFPLFASHGSLRETGILPGITYFVVVGDGLHTESAGQALALSNWFSKRLGRKECSAEQFLKLNALHGVTFDPEGPLRGTKMFLCINYEPQ